MNSRPSTPAGMELVLADQQLWLLPEHAVWWPAESALLIADTHLGKEATFRSAAIPVPDQTVRQLARLDTLLRRTQASRLIVLGDLLHARRGRCPTTFEQIRQWRLLNATLRMDLIRGNHDLRAGDPPDSWQIACHNEPHCINRLMLTHHGTPSERVHAGAAVLAGHLHPVIRMHGPGRDSLRLPCFLLRRNVLTLPAFSPFVDGRAIAVQEGDRIFAAGDNQIVNVTVA